MKKLNWPGAMLGSICHNLLIKWDFYDLTDAMLWHAKLYLAYENTSPKL